MLDLVLPLECGGCGAPSTRWCDACAAALAGQRRRTAPRHPAGRPRRAGLRPRPLRRRRAGRRSSRSRSTAAPTWSRRWRTRWPLGIHQLLTLGHPRCAAHRRARPRPARRRPAGAAATRSPGSPPRDRATPRTSPSSRRCGCGRWSATRWASTSAAGERNLAGRVRLTRPVSRVERPARRRHRHHRRDRRANRCGCCKRPGRRWRPC